MNPENSPNAPTTRDPRLTHSRPPVRTCLDTLPAPQLPNSPVHSQTANKNDVGCEDFIRGISGLVRATLLDNQNRAEKERLQKQRESTERLLKRAKSFPNFPATIEYYQRAREAEDAEISRIDKALDDSTQHQLEKELKTKLPSLASADGKIQELKNEVQATKDESSRFKSQNQSLENMLNAKLAKMEASLKCQAITHSQQNRELNERMNHYQTSSSADSLTTRIISEMENLRQKIASFGTRIDQLWQSQNHCTDSVAKNTETTKKQEEKLDSFKLQDMESIRKELFDVKTRLFSFESSHVSTGHQEQQIPQAELQKLISRIQTLERAPHLVPRVESMEQNLQMLKEISELGNNMRFDEIEKVEKKLQDHVKESSHMSNDIARLSNEVHDLIRSSPTAVQFTTLALSVQQTEKILESVRIGLHSLETRYNNLSTETVVKNMVVAMQEMYPNVSQLTDQTSRLKGLIEKELPSLSARLDGMDQKLQSHISTTRQDASARSDELNRLKHDHSSLSQSLGPLWERFNADGELVSSAGEAISALRTDLESLMATFAEYPPKDQVLTTGDLEVLQSKFNVLDQKMSGFRTSFITQLEGKADDDRIRLKVDKERDRLSGQITSISTRIKELTKNIAELEAANTNGREKLTSQESDIVAVRHDVSQLQESTLNKYQELCKEMDDIRATVESHASEVSPPVSARDATPTKQESPGPAQIRAVAETSPALALREQKKKKKRPRPSGLANEDKGSVTPSESPGSFSSPAPSTSRPDETLEFKKKRKKKRKIDGPITID